MIPIRLKNEDFINLCISMVPISLKILTKVPIRLKILTMILIRLKDGYITQCSDTSTLYLPMTIFELRHVISNNVAF